MSSWGSLSSITSTVSLEVVTSYCKDINFRKDKNFSKIEEQNEELSNPKDIWNKYEDKIVEV